MSIDGVNDSQIQTFQKLLIVNKFGLKNENIEN